MLTLSRLNRVAPGKDQIFVLDFANIAEDIVDAFEPYYKATTLADVTDPNIVHGTMAKLDAAGIYQESEVNGLVADYLANKGNNALTKWVTAARDRFRDRERDAIDHSDKLALDELQLFRWSSETPAAGGVVGWTTIGGLTEKFELRVEPAQLPPRHDHQGSRLPQRVPVVDGEQAASRPAARCAGPPSAQAIRGELSGAARSDARALGTP